MKKHKRIGLLLLAAMTISVAATALVSPFAHSQSPRSKTKVAAPRESEKPAAQPGQIDIKRSLVYVRVDKTGLGHEHGIEGKIKSGVIRLGARTDAGSIEFDMTSFAADTDRARKYVGLEGSTGASTRDKVTKTMLGDGVLDVAEFPTATFAIESALHKKTKQGKAIVELKGKFTLHGTSHPLTLFAEPSQKDGQWNLRGDFTVKQTDFGITPYSAALGTVGVADELKIFGDLWIAGDDAKQE
jgi:polyisoprenoid-binding protein YceI